MGLYSRLALAGAIGAAGVEAGCGDSGTISADPQVYVAVGNECEVGRNYCDARAIARIEPCNSAAERSANALCLDMQNGCLKEVITTLTACSEAENECRVRVQAGDQVCQQECQTTLNQTFFDCQVAEEVGFSACSVAQNAASRVCDEQAKERDDQAREQQEACIEPHTATLNGCEDVNDEARIVCSQQVRDTYSQCQHDCYEPKGEGEPEEDANICVSACQADNERGYGVCNDAGQRASSACNDPFNTAKTECERASNDARQDSSDARQDCYNDSNDPECWPRASLERRLCEQQAQYDGEVCRTPCYEDSKAECETTCYPDSETANQACYRTYETCAIGSIRTAEEACDTLAQERFDLCDVAYDECMAAHPEFQNPATVTEGDSPEFR